MSTLSNRLQVLVDDSRMARLHEAAEETGVSVGEFVRRAIDGALANGSRRARQVELLDFLKSLEPIELGTSDEVLEMISESKSRQFFRDEER